MGKTSIEWTDSSVNPFRAKLPVALNDRVSNSGHYCEKISPGCANCYSSQMQPRFGLPRFQEARNAGVERYIDLCMLEDVLHTKKPTKWFWCDMTDMFGSWVHLTDVALCFAVMAAASQHTHQVLTKRPARAAEFFRLMAAQQTPAGDAVSPGQMLERMLSEAALHLPEPWSYFPDLLAQHVLWPLPNVWFGVSVEDRARLGRIDTLREIPAAVRFLSIEPLLEDLGHIDLRGIHWVIVGGESGPKARPMQADWVRSIRDQCVAQGVRFFFKQWGMWTNGTGKIIDKVSTKKQAGRLLDGREWNEYPKAAP